MDSRKETVVQAVAASDLAALHRVEEELRASRAALAASEQRFQLLIQSVTDYAIYMLDSKGHVITWNEGAERSKGYKPEEVLGKHFSLFFTPETLAAGEPQLQLEVAEKQGRFEAESWRVRKSGDRFWAMVTITAIRGDEGDLTGFAQVTRDMTLVRQIGETHAQLTAEMEKRVAERTSELAATVEELRSKNDEIEALVAMVTHDLSEKEVLLREVYHRVKNNLQVVQSLLKMGSRTLPSEDARKAIETAVQRVHVMAMVHEHLYQMPDLAELTLEGYLRDVVEGAIASNSERPERVQLTLEADLIPIPLDCAIPLGLLANELVSNCIKHGLPGGRSGRIVITARKLPGFVRLVVQDDGVGLPDNFDATRTKSMGLKLAISLAHQLDGRLTFTSDKGCRVEANLARLEQSEKPGFEHAPPAIATHALAFAQRQKSMGSKSLSQEFSRTSNLSS